MLHDPISTSTRRAEAIVPAREPKYATMNGEKTKTPSRGETPARRSGTMQSGLLPTVTGERLKKCVRILLCLVGSAI